MTQTQSKPVRTRFAPAPTGHLHVGSARTALFAWLFARHHGGKFVLRIEDTDVARSQEQFLRPIFDALRWLGLDWDEGPEVGGDYGPYFSSQRLPLYRDSANDLLQRGLAYRCFCSPEELEARRKEAQSKGLPPKYDRRCLSLSEAEQQTRIYHAIPFALRFKMPDEGVTGWDDLVRGPIEFQNALLDDFVILRSNGLPSYLFAVVIDDAGMELTHIVRGEDIISATPRQLLLYQALGKPTPQFGHVPLLLAPDRSKLSKRKQETDILAYREMGYLPEAIFNFLALLGWSPGDDREIMTREELIQAFSLERIGKSGSVFDEEKLNWMNGHYLRHLPLTRPTVFNEEGRKQTIQIGASARDVLVPFEDRAKEFLEKAGLAADPDYLRRVLPLIQERVHRLDELPAAVEFFFREPESYDPAGEKKWFAQPGAAELLAELAARFEKLDAFSVSEIEGAVRALAEEKNLSAAKLIHPLRLAATGRTAGPGLFETLEVLARERVVLRLKKAAARARKLQ